MLSCVQLFATPWTAACQASLSITNSQSSPKPMSIESVMSSNHLILCRPLLLLPSIFPSIRVFSNESALRIWRVSEDFIGKGESFFCPILPVRGGFPGGSDGKESTYSAEDLDLIPKWEDPLDEGMATHSSILVWRIPMDGGAWWATVCGITNSQTLLSD